MNISIILPCYNEADSLRSLLPKLQKNQAQAEIIVVDDGSSDDSVAVAQAAGVTVLSHRYNMGNGAAIKTGARAAKGDVLVFMDADGQHQTQDIERLLKRLDEGYDMVVGARDAGSQASFARLIANSIYNRLGTWMVGHQIKDLTSGFRAVRAEKFREFLSLLPNTFSYPTTITMAFFRAGYLICYEPIKAHKRIGKSHIKLVRDGLRFLLIIFKVGTLYAPLKMFGPLSFLFFFTGVSYYIYTFMSEGRFTNMGAVLLIASLLIFLIGLVSEQITQLLYVQSQKNKHK
jgi:glycosyltransferase involved in cell wall biosynthesis